MGTTPCIQTSALLKLTHSSKLPPYTLAAETAVIGCVNSAIHRLPTNLRAWKKINGEASRRTISQRFRVMANANGSSGQSKGGSKEVILVDPLEAKRLAAAQMQQLQAKAKFKRQREIEAINGAWAMLGLTAGLVIEGYTGDNILSQLAGYLNALAAFLDQYIPS
eukprot:Gb_41380 [translate_table: standard]